MTGNTLDTGARGEIVIYQTPGGETTLEVRLTGDTLWLTQAQIAELFEKERSVVTKHLRNIFSQGELERPSVSAFFAHTAADGKTYHPIFAQNWRGSKPSIRSTLTIEIEWRAHG